MSAHCNHTHTTNSTTNPANPRYRRVLWVALVINATMFGVELVSGWGSGSVALLADAVDFFGDAMNYGISLVVLGMSLVWRARAALLKGVTMGLYGVLVLGRTLWGVFNGTVPEPVTMGVVAVLALMANVLVAVMLYAWREGDANMRSVWLCSRNDALGNLAVLAAAMGVAGTHSAWPDLLVATIMATLALSAAVSVVKAARGELKARTW